ncbi:MAG: glycosyltransferase [Sulfuritalea sp.]|nr:glycosyltransferase [Sulfuritalea sp.]
MNDFPRVLFVTPVAFNRISGGGITFSSLFRGWPKEALATVHNDPQPTTDEVCERYFVLGAGELDFAPPFDHLRRRYRAASAVSASVPEAAAGRIGAASRMKSMALRILGDSFPERARLTPELERWIADYRPQVLYTILGSNGMMSLIEQIRRRFELPLVVHVMDDWVAANHRRGLLGPWQQRQMQRWVRHFMSVADQCLGISPAMCDAYGRRYGRTFQPFQNTIDLERWSPFAKVTLATGSPADLLYVGSIFPNAQLESLVDCCHAVARLNAEGFAATLTIATPRDHAARYGSRLAINPAVRIEPPIEDDEAFFRRIAAADALLLPVNFDPESVRFIRYSMPTKVPAYLAVGTPVFAYGPAATAQIDYALKAGWAEVVDQRDLRDLVEGLRRVITDMELRVRLSADARAAAGRNHDSARIRAEFGDVLRASAAKAVQKGVSRQ